jgi:hypothetical protein
VKVFAVLAWFGGFAALVASLWSWLGWQAGLALLGALLVVHGAAAAVQTDKDQSPRA